MDCVGRCPAEKRWSPGISGFPRQRCMQQGREGRCSFDRIMPCFNRAQRWGMVLGRVSAGEFAAVSLMLGARRLAGRLYLCEADGAACSHRRFGFHMRGGFHPPNTRSIWRATAKATCSRQGLEAT